MNLENLKKALFLFYTPKIGNVRGKEIIQKNQWEQIDFKDLQIQKKVEKEISTIEKNKANAVTLMDDEYPSLLKEIYDPPLVLYYYGNISTKLGIGVVGTRNPSKYGEKACKEIVRELSLYPLEIISGFANGIDTVAHKECVENNGRTFAVMGCGLDFNYPVSNYKMRSEILERNGALISEYSFGTKPEAFRFPSRNRIISGMSTGVVVIEASSESGAIITAKTSIDQGRTVFTVPGSLFLDSFSGNHALLRQGATLVRSAQDILNDLSVFQKEKIKPKSNQKKNEKLLPLFGEEEKLIYSLLEEPVCLDVLIAQTGFAPAKILSFLTQLSLKGAVEERGGFYQKT